jgi:hypothetical protein
MRTPGSTWYDAAAWLGAVDHRSLMEGSLGCAVLGIIQFVPGFECKASH